MERAECLRSIRVRRARPLAILLLWATSTAVPAGVPQLDSVMDREPLLPVQPVERYLPPRWKELWRESLAAPEDDLRREAAAAILREHQLGCPDLDDLGDSLMAALPAAQNRTVRLTIAAALVELDVRDAAPQLFELVREGGTRESLVIEPALGRWGYDPIREVWLGRLADPQEGLVQRLLLAIDGVRLLDERRAAPDLRELVLNRSQQSEVRLKAAEALGELHTGDVTRDARALAADTLPRGIIDRLAAVRILGADRGDGTQQLLLQLAADDQATVAAIALRKLLAIDPRLVKLLVPDLLRRQEAEVRRLAARSLVALPAPDVFDTLGALLNDPHPDVREFVRESLLALSRQEEFDELVRTRTRDVLAGSEWRGLEQAARLVGELNDKSAAIRLVELLEFDRAEVSVTAAWALSRLSVPDTLPQMLAFAEQVAGGIPSDPSVRHEERLNAGQDACLSYLFQAFGTLKYAESEALLLKFVPRRYDLGPRSRGAAVWALGQLHINDPQPDLMNLLGRRVADDGEIPFPEPVEVRTNAAVSLGWMNAQPALEVLRLFYQKGRPGTRVREACGWAIEQLTGEDLPDPETRRVTPATPFLQPLQP